MKTNKKEKRDIAVESLRNALKKNDIKNVEKVLAEYFPEVSLKTTRSKKFKEKQKDFWLDFWHHDFDEYIFSESDFFYELEIINPHLGFYEKIKSNQAKEKFEDLCKIAQKKIEASFKYMPVSFQLRNLISILDFRTSGFYKELSADKYFTSDILTLSSKTPKKDYHESTILELILAYTSRNSLKNAIDIKQKTGLSTASGVNFFKSIPKDDGFCKRYSHLNDKIPLWTLGILNDNAEATEKLLSQLDIYKKNEEIIIPIIETEFAEFNKKLLNKHPNAYLINGWEDVKKAINNCKYLDKDEKLRINSSVDNFTSKILAERILQGMEFKKNNKPTKLKI